MPSFIVHRQQITKLDDINPAHHAHPLLCANDGITYIRIAIWQKYTWDTPFVIAVLCMRNTANVLLFEWSEAWEQFTDCTSQTDAHSGQQSNRLVIHYIRRVYTYQLQSSHLNLIQSVCGVLKSCQWEPNQTKFVDVFACRQLASILSSKWTATRHRPTGWCRIQMML